MSKAHRAVVAVLALFLAASALSQDEPLFPRPPALEAAVKFWTRVYTEISTHEGFIHDSLRLDIVYQTVRIPDSSNPRERRRRIERALDATHDVLLKLAAGAQSSDDERRVLALFPPDTPKTEFRAAAERLRFQLGQADRFKAGLIRSGAYKAYIYQILDKEGLPHELAALPHVESSFDPTAYSKVGAAGLWQFTRSTGMRYMKIDHIVDERRDPFFATAAAARLLADNYSVLQSWPLALTAYNHGLAGMRRAQLQQGTSDIGTIVRKYQSRSFGFASRNFYAAFLAAVDVDANPEAYFGKLDLDDPSPTTVVAVPDYMTAKTLANALNVRVGALRDLNPALMDAVWEGDKLVPKGFALRVPRPTAAVAEELLASVEPKERYAAQRPDLQHRVRRGDTLSQIAAEYHVSLAALMRMNGLSGRDMIRIGQMISLPGEAGGAPVAAAVLVRNDEPPTVAGPIEAGAAATYTVRRGDSIERISTRLGIDTDKLLAANAITNKNRIYAGQTLQLPGAGETAEPADTLFAAADTTPAAAADEAPVAAATAATASALDDDGRGTEAEELEAANAPAVLANGSPAEPDTADADADADADGDTVASAQDALAADPSDYSVSADDQIEVQPLETLGHYADWLEIPTQRLRNLNHLKFHEAVVIGQSLKLDLSHVDAMTFEKRRVAYQQQRQSEFFAAYQIEDTETHTIKSGESLWILAAHQYRVPLWLLRQYNPDLNLDRVQPGTVVKFPRLRAIDGDDNAPAAATVQTVAETAN